jgi:hypothetical protein
MMMRTYLSLLCFGLAIQLGPRFINQVMTVGGGLLEDMPQSTSFTLHSWVTFLDESTTETAIWKLQDNSSEVLSLRYTFANKLSVCPFSICQYMDRTLHKFEWIFLSVSVSDTAINLCIHAWQDSLQCIAFASAAVPLTSTSQVQVASANELYDLQLVLHTLTQSDLQTIVNSYACHSVCSGCAGPSPTACNNFLPVVPLTESKEVVALDYTVGSTPFRGHAYHSVTSIATTGWFKITDYSSGGSGWAELFRLWTEE